jgi:hypothetical protein
MQTMMCLAGFDPYVAMLILLSSVIVMDTCMLMGPTKGWSDTEEYHYLSQFQLPFAKNIIAYVLCKCKNLVGVMVFGHKAADNILFPYVRMPILLASVVVMDMCMLMGPTSGWSETKEYHLLSQFQLPFAKNIIAYVLGKCENLVGVMVFGHKASENILPWLRNNYAKKLLIQGSNVFLSHPQNIRWRYTLKHAQHYIQMFSEIMVPLGVVIPLFVDGLILLRSFLSKKYTLEMMEEFVDSEVLEAVRQRIAMVKIKRTAKVEELQGDVREAKK